MALAFADITDEREPTPVQQTPAGEGPIGLSLSDVADVEPEKPGFFKTLAKSAAEPFTAMAGARRLVTMSDPELTDWLENDYQQSRSQAPGPKAAQLIGGIGGSVAQFAALETAGTALGSETGPAAPFLGLGAASGGMALSSGFEGLKSAYAKAREQNMEPATALPVAKKVSKWDAVIGGVGAVLLPGVAKGATRAMGEIAGKRAIEGAATSSFERAAIQAASKQAPMTAAALAKTAAGGAAVGAGMAGAENIAQRQAGLDTSPTEGMLESAILMGGLPLGLEGLRYARSLYRASRSAAAGGNTAKAEALQKEADKVAEREISKLPKEAQDRLEGYKAKRGKKEPVELPPHEGEGGAPEPEPKPKAPPPVAPAANAEKPPKKAEPTAEEQAALQLELQQSGQVPEIGKEEQSDQVQDKTASEIPPEQRKPIEQQTEVQTQAGTPLKEGEDKGLESTKQLAAELGLKHLKWGEGPPFYGKESLTDPKTGMSIEDLGPKVSRQEVIDRFKAKGADIPKNVGDREARELYESRKAAEARAKLPPTEPKEKLSELVKRVGREGVNELLANYPDEDLELSPDGKSLIGYSDPRNKTGRMRIPTKDFMSWVAEQQAATEPEKITAAAYKDPKTGEVTTGKSHPEILKKLGIKGYETPESRNTPDFGYSSTHRPFLNREEAIPVIEKSGQQLKDYEFGVPHSNEVESPVVPGKAISEVRDVEVIPGPKQPQRVKGARIQPLVTEYTEQLANIRRRIGEIDDETRELVKQHKAEWEKTGISLEDWSQGRLEKLESEKQKLELTRSELFQKEKEIQQSSPVDVPKPAVPSTPQLEQKYRVKSQGPQTFTLVERLAQSDAEKAAGEQPVKVKNDKTGKVETLMEHDLIPIAEKKEKAPVSAKRDLDSELRAAKLDPSVFPDAKSKRAALKRAAALEGKKTRADVPPEQSSPEGKVAPEEKPRKGGKFPTPLRKFNDETQLTGPDILSWIQDNMKLLSKSAAKEKWGKEKFQLNKSLWDDSAALERPHHNVIYSESGSSPDRVAQAAYDAGIIKEPSVSALWDAIKGASKVRGKAFEERNRQESILRQEAKEAAAKSEKREYVPGPFAAPGKSGADIESVTNAIKQKFGDTNKVEVIHDPEQRYSAKIEGRNKITVNAAHTNADHVETDLLEEGLHGVWNDPAVQSAWKEFRDSVSPEDIEAERARRSEAGLPTDNETLAEEAAVARILRTPESTVAQRVWKAITDAIKRVFGIEVKPENREQLLNAAREFLTNGGRERPVEQPRYAAPATKTAIGDLVDRLKSVPASGIRDRIDARAKIADAWAEGKSTFQRVAARLTGISESIKDTGRGIHDETQLKRRKGELDFALQRSSEQSGIAKRLLKEKYRNKIEREATALYQDAGMDTEAIKDAIPFLPKNISPKLRKAIELAANLPDRLKPFAEEQKQFFEKRLDDAKEAGVLEEGLRDYYTHLWEREEDMPDDLRAALSNGKVSDYFQFARKRTIPDFLSGIIAGKKPILDPADVIPFYNYSMDRAIASRQFIKNALDIRMPDGRPMLLPTGTSKTIPSTVKTDPETGEPVVVEIGSGQKWVQPGATIIKPDTMPFIKSGGKWEAQTDYQTVDHPSLRSWKWAGTNEEGNPILFKSDLAVHPDAHEEVSRMMDRSRLTPSRAMKAALGASMEVKGFKLGLLSAFHQVHLSSHALFHWTLPFGFKGEDWYNPETKSFDWSNPKVKLAVEKGHLKLAPDPHELSMFSEGIMGPGLVHKIPILGPLSKAYGEWFFGHYVGRLKMKTFDNALARARWMQKNMGAYKGLTDDQIVARVGDSVQNAYGELNHWFLGKMGRSPQLQRALRLIFLAPDFGEARLRFAGKTFTRFGHEERLAMATMALTLYGGARIANWLTHGDPETSEAKNAFRVKLGGEWFSMRSVIGDATRAVTDSSRFIYARLNPLYSRTISDWIFGRDVYTGRKLTGVEKLLTRPGEQLVPISLQGTLPGQDRRWWEALSSSMGVGAEEDKPERDMREIARNWMKSNSDPKIQAEFTRREQELFAPSDYQGLRQSLLHNDLDKAWTEYKDLQTKGKTPTDIVRSLKPKPFTGQNAREAKFKRSLTDAQRALYQKTIEQHQLLRERYNAMLRLKRD